MTGYLSGIQNTEHYCMATFCPIHIYYAYNTDFLDSSLLPKPHCPILSISGNDSPYQSLFLVFSLITFFFCSSFHILACFSFPFSPTDFKHLYYLKCKTGNASPLLKPFKGSPVPRIHNFVPSLSPNPRNLQFLPPPSGDDSSIHRANVSTTVRLYL